MKTTVEHNNKEQETKYPFIGIADTENIVLFYGKEKGICLSPGNTTNSVGEYCNSWSMSAFEPLNGKIILEND